MIVLGNVINYEKAIDSINFFSPTFFNAFGTGVAKTNPAMEARVSFCSYKELDK